MELVRDALSAQLNRHDYTLGDILSFALTQFKKQRGHLGRIYMVLALVLLISYVGAGWLDSVLQLSAAAPDLKKIGLAPFIHAALLQSVTSISGLVSLVVNSLLGVGTLAIGFEVLQDRKPRVRTLFTLWSKVLRYIGARFAQIAIVLLAFSLPAALAGWVYIAEIDLSPFLKPTELTHLAALFITLFVGVPFWLFVVLYIWLGILFIPAELIYNNASSIRQAIRTSWTISKNNRTEIYSTILVSYLLNLCGVLAFGVGLLVTAPLTWLLWDTLFLTLRSGGDVETAEYTLQNCSV